MIKNNYWLAAGSLIAFFVVSGCTIPPPPCPTDEEPEKTQEWPKNSHQCVLPCDAGEIRIDATWCCDPDVEICPSPATLTLSPSGNVFDNPTLISATAIDALGIYYRINGSINPPDFGNACNNPYLGTAIEIKDTQRISFTSVGNPDPAIWSYPDYISRKKITIKNPTYPNSLLKREFLTAEATLQNKVICDSGIDLKPIGSDGICLPDINVLNKTIRDAFLFPIEPRIWTTGCPVSGQVTMTWAYFGVFLNKPKIPDIRITLNYDSCVIKDSNNNDMTISDLSLGGGSYATVNISKYKLITGSVYFDTSTLVSVVSGTINDGIVREEAIRRYSLGKLVERAADRTGTTFTSCTNSSCASASQEVAYYFTGADYIMFDPESKALDSCD